MSQSKEVVAPPTRDQFVRLDKVGNLAELFKHPDFKQRIMLAAPKHMNAERLLRTFVLASSKTPKLLQCSPMSFMGACITLAALGLEANTPLQHAHLIPFEVNKWNKETRKREYVRTDVQVIVGYPGYIDLIYRGDKVISVHCDVFYPDEEASGAFSYSYGTKKHLHHKPSGKVRKPGEEPAGAYMYAQLANGGEEFTVMRIADIHHARARSQGFQAAMYAHDDAIKNNKDPMKDKRYADAPWIKDFIQMWKKTALRDGQKWLPKSVELAAAISIDGAADEGSIDFSKVIDAESVLAGDYDPETGEVLPHEETVPMPDLNVGGKVTVETGAKTKATKVKTAPAPEPPSHGTPEHTPMPDEPPPFDDGAPQEEVHATATEFPLLNAFGEEDDGPAGATTYPVHFMRAFERSYLECKTDEERTALLEFNQNTIENACAASDTARALMSAMRARVAAEVKKTPQPTAPQEAPRDTAKEEKLYIQNQRTAKGGWDVIAWTNLAKAVISDLDAEGILEFMRLNEPSLSKLPDTAKTIVKNAIEKRQEQLLATVMPEDDEIPMPDDEEPPIEGKWPELYKSFQEDFAAAKTVHDLRAISKHAALKVQLKNLKDARPDLADKLNAQYIAREKELGGG